MSSQPRLKDLSFFVSLKRKRLLYAVVQQTFWRLIDTVGIGAEEDATFRAGRLHPTRQRHDLLAKSLFAKE